METDPKGQGVAGADPVTRKGSQNGAGDVERVSHGSPSEALPQGIVIAQDDCDPLGRVDVERIGGEVVDEPDERYDGLLQLVTSRGAASSPGD